jgi:3-oxoacyl-[acyl-carrier-protein] synthase I
MVAHSSDVAIVATGSVASVGCGTAPLSAALRARINGFERSDRFRSLRSGESFTIARAEVIAPDVSWHSRLVSLVKLATESVELSTAYLPPMPAWCVVPAPVGSANDDNFQRTAALIARTLNDLAPVSDVQMVNMAHDGALTALTAIRSWLTSEEPRSAILCAVDSWLDDARLDELEARGRVRTRSVAQGMIPGEGAGIILFANRAWVTSTKSSVLARLIGIGVGVEPQPWFTEQPCAATGLTTALRAAFSESGESLRADRTWCDLNGEAWRVDEWMYAYIRTVNNQPEPLRLIHPADLWGDIGAASGALLLAMAAHTLHRSAQREAALIWCAADTSGARAAAVLAPW